MRLRARLYAKLPTVTADDAFTGTSCAIEYRSQRCSHDARVGTNIVVVMEIAPDKRGMQQPWRVFVTMSAQPSSDASTAEDRTIRGGGGRQSIPAFQ